MTVKKLNNHPIEQACKKLLESEKQQPSSNLLFSLQLIDRFLETHNLIGHWKKNEYFFREQIKAWMSPYPRIARNAQSVLYGETTTRDLSNNPDEVAMCLLENMETALDLP